uniref:Uncharacterized protein n=1 Tax=Arundo donax TaxID=35708 RepID=A0A0A8YZD7_ARUDO
MLFRNFVTDP